MNDTEVHDVQAVFDQNGRDLIASGSDGLRTWHSPPLQEIRTDWLKPGTSLGAMNQPTLEPVTVKSTNNLRDGNGD